MAKKFAKKFYNSASWKKAQAVYRAMKYGICERCGSPNGTIVHHKIHIDESNIDDVNVTLNFDNFELLCQDCHNHEHHSTHKATVNGLRFNSKGELIKV